MPEQDDIRRHVERLEAELASGATFEPLKSSLEAIVDALPDIIYRVDGEGLIVFISEAIRKYGYDPERLVDTSLFDIIHPDDRERARHRVNERRTGERSTRSLELRLITAADDAVEVEVHESDTAAPVVRVEAQGIYATDSPTAEHFLYTQGVARDVSERRRLEASLEEASTQVARSMGQHAVQIRAAYGQLQRQFEERDRRAAESRVLQRVRDEIWRMQSPDELVRVLQTVHDGLLDLELDFHALAVNLIEPEGQPRRTGIYVRGGAESGWYSSVEPEHRRRIESFVAAGEIRYRPDLHVEDALGERERIEAAWGTPVHAVVDLPFDSGTVALNSRRPNAFDSQEIELLEQMASVLAEGFRRARDLEALQANARALEALAAQRQADLERESALGRIRDRVLAMRHLGDLPEAEHWIAELGNLGVPIGGISLQLPGPSPDTFVSYFLRGGSTKATSLSRCPWVGEVWESGEPVLVPRERLVELGLAAWKIDCILEMPVPGGGSLAVNRADGGSFDESMIETTAAFASVVAQGVQRLRDFQRLAESEQNYRSLVEKLPIGVMHTATSGRVLYQNPYVSAMLGYTTEELNRISLGDLYVDPEDKRRLMDALRDEGSASLECQLLRKGGGMVWVRGTARAVTDPVTGTRQYQGFLEDATERRVMEGEYARLEEQLRQSQKMEAVGQLTAGIAHNFNNMLQGISGNLQLALLDADEQLAELLEDADQVTHRAADMIRQLMVFARQGIQPSIRPISLGPVIADTIEICRRSFDRKIEILVDGAPDLTVLGDAGLLQQALLSLLINARDALETAAHPTIRISAHGADVQPVVDGRARAVAGFAEVRVSDNGEGMNAATRQRIFDPFFTTKTVDKGTGLGLATVYGIISQHQGWVTCDSEPGKGATFSVFLPVDETATAAPEAVPETDGAEAALKGTLLVIDDEDVVRETTRRLLERLGYRVLLAADGAHGLLLFREQIEAVQLVLLDLSMPEMSGREVLAQLRHLRPDIRVLIFTGYSSEVGDVEGADGIVEKPFTVRELTGKIQALLTDGAAAGANG